MSGEPLPIMTMHWSVAPVSPSTQPPARLDTAPLYISSDGTLQRPSNTQPLPAYELANTEPLDLSTAWAGAGTGGAGIVAMQIDGLPAVFTDSKLTSVTMLFAALPSDVLVTVLPMLYGTADGEETHTVSFAPGARPPFPIIVNDDWAVGGASNDEIRGDYAVVIQRRASVTTLLQLHLTLRPGLRLQAGHAIAIYARSNDIHGQTPTLHPLQATQLFTQYAQVPAAVNVTVGWAACAPCDTALPLIVWWTPVLTDEGTAIPSSDPLPSLREAGVTHWLVRNVLHPQQQVLVPLGDTSVRLAAVCTPLQPCVQFSVSIAAPAEPSLAALLPGIWLRPGMPSNVLNLRAARLPPPRKSYA